MKDRSIIIWAVLAVVGLASAVLYSCEPPAQYTCEAGQVLDERSKQCYELCGRTGMYNTETRTCESRVVTLTVGTEGGIVSYFRSDSGAPVFFDIPEDTVSEVTISLGGLPDSAIDLAKSEILSAVMSASPRYSSGGAPLSAGDVTLNSLNVSIANTDGELVLTLNSYELGLNDPLNEDHTLFLRLRPRSGFSDRALLPGTLKSTLEAHLNGPDFINDGSNLGYTVDIESMIPETIEIGMLKSRSVGN